MDLMSPWSMDDISFSSAMSSMAWLSEQMPIC